MLADAAADLAAVATPLVNANPRSAAVDALGVLAPVDADALTAAVLASIAATVVHTQTAAPTIAAHVPPPSVRAYSRTSTIATGILGTTMLAFHHLIGKFKQAQTPLGAP